MQRNWTKKNVDLALLTARIADFFKEKDFEAIKGETSTGYQILGEDSPHFKIPGYVSVTIEGKPEDFTVKLDHCRNKKRPPRFSPFLLTMFGGGYLISRRLKSEEAWTKLETELWKHVEKAVSHSTNSAETLT